MPHPVLVFPEGGSEWVCGGPKPRREVAGMAAEGGEEAEAEEAEEEGRKRARRGEGE